MAASTMGLRVLLALTSRLSASTKGPVACGSAAWPCVEASTAREIWPDEPAKAAQKDVDARWTLKIRGKVRHRPDGTPLPMIATPVFGYKSHISIDRRFGFIREAVVTSPRLPTDGNSNVW